MYYLKNNYIFIKYQCGKGTIEHIYSPINKLELQNEIVIDNPDITNRIYAKLVDISISADGESLIETYNDLNGEIVRFKINGEVIEVSTVDGVAIVDVYKETNEDIEIKAVFGSHNGDEYSIII